AAAAGSGRGAESAWRGLVGEVAGEEPFDEEPAGDGGRDGVEEDRVADPDVGHGRLAPVADELGGGVDGVGGGRAAARPDGARGGRLRGHGALDALLAVDATAASESRRRTVSRGRARGAAGARVAFDDEDGGDCDETCGDEDRGGPR